MMFHPSHTHSAPERRSSSSIVRAAISFRSIERRAGTCISPDRSGPAAVEPATLTWRTGSVRSRSIEISNRPTMAEFFAA